MSLLDPHGQTNPEDEPDYVLQELQRKVGHAVTVLDENKRGLYRWFWRVLFAFNLVLWSIALPIIAVVLLRLNAA